MDVDGEGCFQDLPPNREQHAKARFLDEPGSVGVQVQDDICGRRLVASFRLAWHRVEVELRYRVPVAAGGGENRVVEVAHIAPFPEPLDVLRAPSGADVLAAEVEAHQVQDPGERRRAGPMHPEYENLHVVRRVRRGLMR